MEDEINDEQENENSVVDFSLDTEFERTAREKHQHFQQDVVCCIHLATDLELGTQKITLFNENSFKKVSEVLQARKDQNLPHSHFAVPQGSDNRHGYHITCYRKFVALSKKQTEKMHESMNKKELTIIHKSEKLTRSAVSSPKSISNAGIFPQVCLFCSKSRKKISGKELKLVSVETLDFEENIKKYAEWLNDQNMLSRITSINFVAKEVRYHAFCRKRYQSDAEATEEGRSTKKRNRSDHLLKSGKEIPQSPSKRPWHKERYLHDNAFNALKVFIDEYVIVKKEVHLLSDINKYYESILREIGGEEFKDVNSSAQKLEQKLLKQYGNNLKIDKGKTKRGNVISSSILTAEETLRGHHSNITKDNVQIRDVALILREAIFTTETKRLPDNLTIKDIFKGEVEVPPLLKTFFSYLIGGPDTRNWSNPRKYQRIESISQDAIFSSTNGTKKPHKHLQLALALKGLTGSKKTIDILNRHGHCVSYSTTEELETELTYEATRTTEVTPYGMNKSSESGIGVAWDNYDRTVETSGGDSTLHDTVGIAYQSITAENNEITEAPTCENAVSTKGRKRRRTYEASDLDIQPYRKKPKMVASNYIPLDDQRRLKDEPVATIISKSWKKDILWMTDFFTDPDMSTPMWVGWNSMLIPRDESLQKVWYLPQINMSPTSHSVVIETMRRSQCIANECGKTSIVVSYDLAIAKIAMQIQAEESPKFDNIFVAMGSFHIELAFFSAMGKIVSESGAPHLLTECGIFQKGSLNGFLKGKHYNRCKRFHEYLSLSLECLHFESFLESIECQDNIICIIHSEVKKIKEDKHLEDHTFSKEMEDVFNHYHQYKTATLDEKHGKTAKFWMQYVEMYHLYRDFTRSVRVGDLNLYISCLPKLSNYFFALNHPNYARWTVQYYNNLILVPETHPEAYSEFKRGLFSIKRTGKSFSGNPIDLTLEQTINADSASQRTGISALTNSISARQRWAQFNFISSSIISHVFESLNINKKEDISAKLKPYNIRKDNECVGKLVKIIQDNLNPFDSSEPNHLFNLATGKSAKKETENFVLNIAQLGNEKRKKFISECIETPERFEKPIKREKLQTFATEAGKKKITSKDGKLIESCLVRDIFGSILFLSLQRKVDMEEVLTYPLTPVPLSLSHVNGSMLTTEKSLLMRNIEERVTTIPPFVTDQTVIDASFFLYLQKDLPVMFGKISIILLRKIMAFDGNIIHFVTDKWLQPSIKDNERDVRNSTQASYQIKGPEQKRPSNWTDSLKNPNFKIALNKYLIDAWRDDNLACIFGTKTLYANCGDKCYKYTANGTEVFREEEHRLFSTHEEADSRMFHHVAFSNCENHCFGGPVNIVVRTNDTDCLIISLGCFKALKYVNSELFLWLEVGLDSKNNRRYISINQLYETLGESLALALPAFHAFSGCDYLAAFSRKGKVRPFKLLETDQHFQIAFANLGNETPELDEQDVKQIEKFVCKMYGHKTISSVNNVRLQTFLQKYKPKKESQKITCVKKLDGSSMAPCFRVLSKKILRTSLIARRWRSSIIPFQPALSPLDYGWTLQDGKYRIDWFHGEQAPTSLDIIMQEDDDDVEEENQDSAEVDYISDDESSDDDGDDNI